MSTQPLPAPLVPAYVDLRNFDFMPLDVKRLADSELAANADPASAWFAVMLWCKSWHQIPAGSIPNNDAWMTKAVGLGRDIGTWMPHREFALRGFVLCEDGLLYHTTVCEKALQAWIAKLKQARKSVRGNSARWGIDADEAALQAQLDEAEEALARLSGKPPKPAPKPAPKVIPVEPAPPVEPVKAAEPEPAPAPVAPPPADEPPRGKKPTRRRSARPGLSDAANYSAAFEAWWAEFPPTRKTNKAGCWAIWERDQLEEYAGTLLKDVQKRKAQDWNWVKDGGEYVPMPFTYLNQKRWNAEMRPFPTGHGRRSSTESNNDRTAEDWARDGVTE